MENKTPEQICECGHSRNWHNDNGECYVREHSQIRIGDKFNCSCKRFENKTPTGKIDNRFLTNTPNKMIISREEAEKKFTKGFINLVIDTAKPLTNMFGIDIFVTSEDIGKNALLFEYPVKELKHEN